MAGVGEVIVPVIIKVESVENSQGLRALLKDLIKEELANLEPESVKVLTDQIVKQFENR